jgi:MFS family permease
MIRRCGSRVPPLTVGGLGPHVTIGRDELPPFMALFRPGQLRWTIVGIVTGISASTAYYTCAILLPKALVDQGGAVALSFGLASLLFMASIPGKLFTGYLMEVIGRRWTMTYSLAGSLPGIGLMAAAHWAGSLMSVVFIAGGLITGFTILSAFLARGSICPSNSPPNCVAAGTSSANQPRG